MEEILYVYGQKKLAVYQRGKEGFTAMYSKNVNNLASLTEKWTLGKVHDDYLYLNIGEDLHIWSISQDCLLSKNPK